jgi:hypothetical protein
VRKDPVWDLLEEMAVLLDRFAARPPSADPGLRRHPLSVREAFRKLDELRAKRAEEIQVVITEHPRDLYAEGYSAGLSAGVGGRPGMGVR